MKTAVRESKDRFYYLAQAAFEGICLSENGRICDINDQVLKMFGYKREEMLGKAIVEMVAPGSRAFVAKAIRTGREVAYEHQLLRKDGSVFYAEAKAKMFKAGSRWLRMTALRDITERKQAEEKLKENEAKLRALFEGSIFPMGMAKDGITIMVNPAYTRLFGYSSASELTGKSIFDDIAPEENERVREFARRRTKGELAPAFYETRGIKRDGTVFDMAVAVSTYKLDGAVYTIGILRDITENKRAEETQARLATAIEQAAETIVITDTQGTILYANPAFQQSTGYTREEAIGQNPRILKSGRQDTEFYRRMWEVLECGEVWQGHFINRRKDGVLYEEEATISPVRDAKGRIVNYVAVKRDVTREVQLESQFRQAQKMEAFGKLAGGVAHDFNNILAVIRLQAGLLKTGPGVSPQLLDSANDIEKAAERAANLIRQLLLFSKRQVMQPCDLDLNQCISDMTKMLRRILGEDVQMQFKFAPQRLLIHADAGMLDQILLNLVVNSRDAMPKGGRLLIETSAVEFDESVRAQSAQARPGAFVCLSVSDTGQGIPPENLPRIFEPFFTTKEVGKGSGLGLATVFGIVEQHQGWINVHSEVGQGTTFHIYLPRLARMSAQNPGQPALTSVPGGNETILLVEDDTAVSASVHKTLSQLGYRVLDAINGIEALEVWKQNRGKIHLLLTDLVMPGGMTGKELGERLLKENPELKVIYTSGYSLEVTGRNLPLKEGVNFLSSKR